jgi:hypothetical protein
MAALATAFGLAWMATALYVGWLRNNQRTLAARLDALVGHKADSPPHKSPTARAA